METANRLRLKLVARSVRWWASPPPEGCYFLRIFVAYAARRTSALATTTSLSFAFVVSAPHKGQHQNRSRSFLRLARRSYFRPIIYHGPIRRWAITAPWQVVDLSGTAPESEPYFDRPNYDHPPAFTGGVNTLSVLGSLLPTCRLVRPTTHSGAAKVFAAQVNPNHNRLQHSCQERGWRRRFQRWRIPWHGPSAHHRVVDLCLRNTDRLDSGFALVPNCLKQPGHNPREGMLAAPASFL